MLSFTGAAGAERFDPWDPHATRDAGPVDALVGQGGYASVQAAIDAVMRGVRDGSPRRRRIVIGAGRYAGPIYVPRTAPPLTIEAAGDVEIAASIDAEMPGAEYRRRFGTLFRGAHPATRALFEGIASCERITTQNAAVVRIESDDAILRGLSVRNTYGCDRTSAASPGAVPDRNGRFAAGQHQAVAVHVAGADRLWLDRVRMSSFQDTLYLQHPEPFSTSRSYLKHCEIEGDVDFVFGQATAYFEACTLRARYDRGAPVWCVAPATNLRTSFGFVFRRCDFTADRADAPGGSARIGRQWFEGVRATPYGKSPVRGYSCRIGARSAYAPPKGMISRATLEAVGKCVVLDSRIGPHIDARRPWDDWSGPRSDPESGALGARWSPRFRPVQVSPRDFRARLGTWLHENRLSYDDLSPDEAWLGFHRCR